MARSPWWSRGTVANLGPYRVGIISVDGERGEAVVSVLEADSPGPPQTLTLRVGVPVELAEGTLALLEADERGSARDTVRLGYQAK